MSFSTEIDVVVQCKCGQGLEVISTAYGRQVTIEVEPCAECIAEACARETQEQS